MTDMSKASRRVVMRAGITAIAAGIAGSAMAAETLSRRLVAQDKLAQDAVQYQLTPKDGAKCSTCVNFIAPNACQIVSGTISPDGWCIAYGPKNG